MKHSILSIILFCLVIQAFPQKYVKVWSDEFNTPGLPDSTKWDYEVGKIRNDELQYYTYKRAENARIQDTVLIIEARKETYQGVAYTSASLKSRYNGDWLYGKFEIRAKVPTGKGTWPAIWMMPTDDEYGGWPKSGEIDIMEYVGMNPSNLYFTTHFEGTDGTGHQNSGSYATFTQPYNKFITFTLIWSPVKLEWYADGVKYHTYTKTSDDPRVWPFNKMFYFIMNLTYGGWGAQQGIDDTKLPHKFYIDYVRVYQLQETSGPFSLTVNPATGGSVEISPKQDTYPEGTLVTLTAKPESNYEFDKWLHVGSANPIQIEISKNMSLLPVFKKKNELILNGDFSQGSKKWSGLWFNSPLTTAATSSVVDGVYVVNVTKPGTENWHIVDQQANIPLIQGTTYQISFEAKADNPNSMDVFLSKNYGDYGGYYSTVKSISGVMKKFTWTVKMSSPTDYNCRFGFGFGRFNGKVYIDNVSIEKMVATGSELLPNVDSEDVRIYPNPTNGSPELNIEVGNLRPTDFDICNIQGQIICQHKADKSMPIGQSIRFNLKEHHIGKGIYLIRFSGNGKKIARKLVVN